MTRWQTEREEHQLQLARKLGLPVGRQVEVWLRGGVRLRGKLELQEVKLISAGLKEDLKLVVDGTPFLGEDIESCIRI